MNGESFEDSLAGSEWTPVELAGAPVEEGVRAMIQFGAEGRVTGLAGCNRFSGTFQVEAGTIAFGTLAVTRRACPPPRMQFERAFLDALEGSTAYRRDGTRLDLLGFDGHPVMRLRQTDWD